MGAWEAAPEEAVAAPAWGGRTPAAAASKRDREQWWGRWEEGPGGREIASFAFGGQRRTGQLRRKSHFAAATSSSSD